LGLLVFATGAFDVVWGHMQAKVAGFLNPDAPADPINELTGNKSPSRAPRTPGGVAGMRGIIADQRNDGVDSKDELLNILKEINGTIKDCERDIADLQTKLQAAKDGANNASFVLRMLNIRTKYNGTIIDCERDIADLQKKLQEAKDAKNGASKLLKKRDKDILEWDRLKKDLKL